MPQLRAQCRMIDFACRCNYRFSLPEDQAGGFIQCPHCKRLVDIPRLGDLDHIDADGSYKVDAGINPLSEPDRLAALHKSFTRQRTDETGSDIDLRTTMEDVLQAGTEGLAYELAEQTKPSAPKYDPVTGERLRVIDVTPGEQRVDPATVPMAQRAVEYAGADLSPSSGLLRIGMRLLAPVNLFVMSIVLAFHFFFEPVSLMMLAGFFLVAPLWIIGIGVLLAHYGNVIDETGPGERDELPRPLRDAALSDDVWRPFTHVAGALLLCYLPLLAGHRLNAETPILLGLMLLGTLLLPAVLLTLVAGGTLLNLRPDRVIGVILALGWRYLTVVLMLITAIVTYTLALWRLHIDSARLFLPRSQSGFAGPIPWWFDWYVAYPALVVGIYLMHWFCWSLGAAYRAHHPQFPWVMQRHFARRLRARTALPPGTKRASTANSAAVKRKLGT